MPAVFEGYQVVDESDVVDKLVGKYFVEKYAGVPVIRISSQFYTVGDKQVYMKADGDNKDFLKVRVGSTWISFDDYLTQAKVKFDSMVEEE